MSSCDYELVDAVRPPGVQFPLDQTNLKKKLKLLLKLVLSNYYACILCLYSHTTTSFAKTEKNSGSYTIENDSSAYYLSCSHDCPIFYMCKNIQKDLVDQDKLVKRFGVSDW